MFMDLISVFVFLFGARPTIQYYIRAIRARDLIIENLQDDGWFERQAQKSSFRDDWKLREKAIQNTFLFYGIVIGFLSAATMYAAIYLWRYS